MTFLATAALFGLCYAPVAAGPTSEAKPDDKPDIHGALMPHDTSVTLGAKDFTAELPQNLHNEPIECKTASVKVDKKVSFEVTVHYDQLTQHPNFFRRVEVSLPRPVPEVTVGVVFGFPTNLGTQDKPLMAVPFTLQWAGPGWLRGEQWTLFADGRLERTE